MQFLDAMGYGYGKSNSLRCGRLPLRIASRRNEVLICKKPRV